MALLPCLAALSACLLLADAPSRSYPEEVVEARRQVERLDPPRALSARCERAVKEVAALKTQESVAFARQLAKAAGLADPAPEASTAPTADATRAVMAAWAGALIEPARERLGRSFELPGENAGCKVLAAIATACPSSVARVQAAAVWLGMVLAW